MGLHRRPLRVPPVRQQEITSQDHVMGRRGRAFLLLFPPAFASKDHGGRGSQELGVRSVLFFYMLFPWALTGVSVDHQDSAVPEET